MGVVKQVKGMTVEAMPRFRGGSVPDYWVAVVNNRIIFRTFKSPTELFGFVDQHYPNIVRSRRPQVARAVASS